MHIYLSAGEPSGDQYGAAVAEALHARLPNALLEGMGGPAMMRSGVTLTHAIGERSARGLIEAVAHAPHHVQLFGRTRRAIRRGRYDLLILIDYPGFHLALARAARRVGVPVLYFVAPQIWAWGAWRLAALRRDVDRLAVILPFEQPYFRSHGVAAEFVGHPLLDRPPVLRTEAARQALGLSSDVPVLGLFPGSRREEIRRHWPVFRDAARLASCRIPKLAVLIAGVDEEDYADNPGFRVAEARAVLAAATAGICKSGTTTLEAALAGMPQVVGYRMHPATYAVARRAVRVPWIGLVNLVAGGPVAPECIQAQCTPDALAGALMPLLESGSRAAAAQRAVHAEIRAALGPPGAAARVAALAEELAA